MDSKEAENIAPFKRGEGCIIHVYANLFVIYYQLISWRGY